MQAGKNKRGRRVYLDVMRNAYAQTTVAAYSVRAGRGARVATPLEWDELDGRRGDLKATLLDQSVIAGLGNLLIDEICWPARLHPSRRVTDFDGDDVKRLHATMKRVLRTSVRHGRVPGLAR